MFAGYYELGDTALIPIQARNTSRVPVSADSLPTYRVYGQSGLIASGTVAKKDTGSVTGASNASPIVITSASHGLTTGTKVTIAGVAGNTAANGSFVVTRIDANTFSLDGSTGNGTYTSGGSWEVTGLYQAEIVLSSANGFAQDGNYDIVFDYQVSAIHQRDLLRIGVS
ncbi:MAG: hypothetical protein HC888_00490 [Candidatus Competibacteraceae bacterium]|nr:hypothetical protein [Candidatus Competibacteraceae bacterium]